MNSDSVIKEREDASIDLQLLHRRDVFVIAEWAGFVVLESQEHVIERGQEVLTFVSGSSISTHAYHVTTPHSKGRVCLLP